MVYSITLKDLKKIDYNLFKNIVPEDTELYGPPGKEHYRLLSYFSTLYNDSNILDIGTHQGHSALALSYNKTNHIYTFDIIDKVKKAIKNIENITFHNDNLFDKTIFNKWKDIILSCPFILVDIADSNDQHNGVLEYNFVNSLKEINYAGFIIFDDIWYFKKMRDEFWYKIEDQYRFDLTAIGHWSGTGIITFNSEYVFHKYDVSNWTLVTAYFDLTKYFDASVETKSNDKHYYMSNSLSTLQLPYNLVIYSDSETINTIKKLRPTYLEHKTKYIIRNFNDIRFKKDGKLLTECFDNYRRIIIQNRKEHPYNFDNRNNASYYLLCLSRYVLLKETIEENYFDSTHFCWINFDIERMGCKNLIRLPEALSLNRNKFSTCYIDYIPERLVKNTDEYFKWGRCSMCSGFFTGNKKYMYQVCDLIEDMFLKYLREGYGHADEQLYSPVYFENPSLFEHYYGDYQQMITNYTYIYDAPYAPIQNFIKNSFINHDYKKCYEGCTFVFNSWIKNKCEIDPQNIHKLLDYYMQSKKHIDWKDWSPSTAPSPIPSEGLSLSPSVSPPADPSMIPKCIYQTWETHDIHGDLQKFMNSWKEKNPTFTYKLYNKEERKTFIINHFKPNVIETYRKIKPGPLKADLWRYCILYITGGFYADIDTLCYDSIENYIKDTTEFISVVDLYASQTPYNLANAFIGIKAGHPIMLSCIHAIIKDVKDNKIHHSGMDFCGPGCLGIATNKYLRRPANASFRYKEGQLEKGIILLKFVTGSEYITDNSGNILFQNKNGNKEIQEAYKIEAQKNSLMYDWGKYYWNGTRK